MGVKIKLYTTAEALAAIMAAELEKVNLHDDEHDAINAFADIRDIYSGLVTSESPLIDMMRLLKDHGFEYAMRHSNGKRYWCRIADITTAINATIAE